MKLRLGLGLGLLLSAQHTQLVLRRFQPHRQLLHERKQLRRRDMVVRGKRGPGADLFQRQARGFMRLEPRAGFEVQGAVSALVVSWNLRGDCYSWLH